MVLHDLRDPDGNLIVEDQEIRKNLPNMVSADVAVAVAAAGGVAAGGVGGSFGFNFILNLLMSTSMNQMLGSIKNLQVIVHLVLMNFIVPAVTQIFFAAVIQMIAFDPFEGAGEYTKEYLSLEADDEEDEPVLAENFVQLGYESPYYLTNLGSLLYIVLAYLALIPVFALLAVMPCCSEKVKKWSANKVQGAFYNGLLSFVDGTFLLLFITGMINIKHV